MKKTKAFTLIEVMIVLTVLALVAILAYSFFGNTMKEAKQLAVLTETHKAMTSISAALEKYYLDNGSFMSSGLTDAERMDLLVQGGYLKATIIPPSEIASIPNYGITFWDGYNFDMVGGQNGDMLIQAAYVSEEMCDAWNERYAPETGGVQPRWSANGAVWQADGRYITACYESYATPANNYIRLAAVADAGAAP